MTSTPRPSRTARKVAATIAVVAALAALELFAALGSFDQRHDAMPTSVVVHAPRATRH